MNTHLLLKVHQGCNDCNNHDLIQQFSSKLDGSYSLCLIPAFLPPTLINFSVQQLRNACNPSWKGFFLILHDRTHSMLIWTPKTDDLVQLEKHAADLLQNPTTFYFAAIMSLRITVFWFSSLILGVGDCLFVFVSIQLISESTKLRSWTVQLCGISIRQVENIKGTNLMF